MHSCSVQKEAFKRLIKHKLIILFDNSFFMIIFFWAASFDAAFFLIYSIYEKAFYSYIQKQLSDLILTASVLLIYRNENCMVNRPYNYIYIETQVTKIKLTKILFFQKLTYHIWAQTLVQIHIYRNYFSGRQAKTVGMPLFYAKKLY